MAFFMWFSESKMYYPRPMLFIFNDIEQFRANNKMSDGTVRHRGGVFMPGMVGPRIALARKSPKQSLAVFFHECAHSMVSASGYRLPTWLSEGVAEVYETFQVSGDIVTLGRLHAGRMALLRKEQFIPLDTFFNVTQSDPYYNDADKKGLFYAQAWLITHYIMLGRTDSRHPVANLQKYIELYKKKRKPTEAELSEVFGMSYAELEKALRNHLANGRTKYYSMRLPITAAREKITCREAEAREIECELEALKFRMTRDRTSDAEKTMDQLVKKYPKDPRAWELFAELSSPAKRVERMQKAVELGSQNPLVRIWLLRDKVRRVRWSLDARMPVAESEKLRAEAEHILALEPDCMEAHAMLATIEAMSADMRVSIIQRSNTALKQMNDREYYETLLAMAVVCWRLRDASQAATVLQRVLDADGVSPQVLQRAKQLKARMGR